MNEGLSLLIMGRPNVGKSTLFNRLLGKRVALTANQPGTTRDWQVYECTLEGLALRLYDVPGLELLTKQQSFSTELMASMWAQAEKLLACCDAVLLLFDAQTGLHPDDRLLAKWLHEKGARVILIANKVEKKMDPSLFAESFELGFGEPVTLSALHGQGFPELIRTLRALPTRSIQEPLSREGPIVAVLGRPNVGKSTFINQAIGQDRLLVGPQAGITRDCITVATHWQDRDVRFVDTAGLRKRATIDDPLEKDACHESFHALFFCNVALLMLDATRGLEKQDLTIFQKVEEEGRGIVIAVNKWDQVKKAGVYLAGLRQCIDEQCHSKGIPLIPISSRTGFGMKALANAIFAVYHRWNIRLPTSMINQWLQQRLQAHPPPLANGRTVKIKYIHQSKTRPPTFTLFGNQLDTLDTSYKRYLTNALIEDFSLQGASTRLLFRTSQNPYVKK